jgi:hypothetical protein
LSVGVDVQAPPLAVDGDRRHYRDVVLGEETVEHLGVDLLDLADMSKIDLLEGFPDLHPLGFHLPGDEEVAVVS